MNACFQTSFCDNNVFKELLITEAWWHIGTSSASYTTGHAFCIALSVTQYIVISPILIEYLAFRTSILYFFSHAVIF